MVRASHVKCSQIDNVYLFIHSRPNSLILCCTALYLTSLNFTVKYGQGLEQIRAGAGKGGIDMSSNSYAMFSSSMHGHQNMSEIQKSQELRRRPGPGTDDSSSSINQNTNQNINSNSRTPLKGGDYRVYSGGSSNAYDAQGGGSQYMQTQLQQQQRPDRDYVSRVKGAEKVEKAISQVNYIRLLFHLFRMNCTLFYE